MELFRCIPRLKAVTLGRQIHTTRVCAMHSWRKKHGLPVNKNTCGPLTDLPDYTFLDGRVTPIGSHQKSRYLEQMQLTEKMVDYIGEIDFAQSRYKKKVEEKEREVKSLMENKLKDKGQSKFFKK